MTPSASANTSSDAHRFDLYSFWRTSATYRVRVACNFKGVVPMEHNVNLDGGEQHSNAFLKINPMAAIPALVDRDAGPSRTPLTQSMAIMEFLDESYPTPALLPADVQGRAGALARRNARRRHPSADYGAGKKVSGCLRSVR
jgi:glutathione S-transferase